MNQRRKTPAGLIAFGGVMAALAVVIMSLGGLIPVATYTSPMLCAVLMQIVLQNCGRRIGWAWYFAVAILAVLLSPDKEAAGVFVFLGYYPILKPGFDKTKLRYVWKAAYFNASVLLLYAILIRLLGMAELGQEFMEYGIIMLIVLMVMGNCIFFLLDHLLGMDKIKRIRIYG